MTKHCTSCNAINISDAQFCDKCGSQFDSTIQCHNCQTKNDAAARYCYRCGQSLAAPASVKTAVDHHRSVSEPVSRFAHDAGGSQGISGSGWQPAPAAQPVLAESPPSQDRYNIRVPEMRIGTMKTRRFSWIKALLSIPALAGILWIFLLLSDTGLPGGEERLFVLLVGYISVASLFWLWRRKGSRTHRGNHSIHGEVRGFRERKERKNQLATLDDTVWTFRLERYQNGHRLPPIPVEMRGRTFTGFINEGDTVQLLDEWHGEGLHRANKVNNVTNGAMVETKEIGHSIRPILRLILWLIFGFSLFAAFSLYLGL